MLPIVPPPAPIVARAAHGPRRLLLRQPPSAPQTGVLVRAWRYLFGTGAGHGGRQRQFGAAAQASVASRARTGDVARAVANIAASGVRTIAGPRRDAHGEARRHERGERGERGDRPRHARDEQGKRDERGDRPGGPRRDEPRREEARPEAPSR